MIHKFFHKTFLINLKKREDRLLKATNQCTDIGLQFERFEAVDGELNNLTIIKASDIGLPEVYWNLGAAGLVVTCQQILEKSIEMKYDSILILEDDVIFHPEINILADQWMHEIPTDWETIYFSALHIKPFFEISKNVARIVCGYHTHCWAIKSSIFGLCLEKLKNLDNPLDIIIANHIHPRGKSYCFKKNLVHQSADFSDIMRRKVEYKD